MNFLKMEDTRGKRTAETNREKQKKKYVQEKKTRSETTAFSTGSSLTDPSLESIAVVGKGCGYARSKVQESGYRLHECYSEAAINLVPDSSKNLMDIVRVEGLHPVASNSSFLSAKSDFSDTLHRRIHELEDALYNQNMVNYCLKKQVGEKGVVGVSSVSTETDISASDIEAFKSRLKELEKKISCKERKIKELTQKIEDSAKARDAQNKENKGLTHQVNLLNRQLKSMFELLGTKNWNSPVDQGEVAKLKGKVAELEALVGAKEEEKNGLSRKIESLSAGLEAKETELNLKSRELVEYKNKSTLEMCKLITQIDSLQKEAENHSQLLESKLSEARNLMDEEIVSITQRLEEQYQKDVKSAIDKFQRDFERLSELPKAAIDRLLQFCEPEKADLIGFQQEWDKQRQMLEAKIQTMNQDRSKEMTQLKDSYEGKVMFLKTQVEALSSQLKERKEIIDIFESELLEYKSNSSMNLLKASTLGDDISSLKELYTAELFSQKQVHKLQMNIFEEKVKTLTEEILYHAKNEEIHLQELENSKKMALAFREKYEQLVSEWEERVERDLKVKPAGSDVAVPELDSMVSEFRGLLESLRKSESAHEERIRLLESQNDDEKLSLLQDVENFKAKLGELRNFQKTQVQLDETIHDLIRTVGINYSKTVETLLLSHVTELSLKQVEMCASEKRHIEEIDALKNDHEKELEELRGKVKALEESGHAGETDEEKSRRREELEALRRKAEELTVERMKMEGMMVVKEETEGALNERIRQLEDTLRAREENCRQKLEDLTVECLKMQALSSAKEELAAEMEDRLNRSGKLLEKSFGDIDWMTEAWRQLEGSAKEESHLNDGGDCNRCEVGFERAKSSGERLKGELLEVLERLEGLEERRGVGEEGVKAGVTVAETESSSEEEKKEILGENIKMKEEIKSLIQNLAKTEKKLAELNSHKEELSELKERLKELENEKSEMALREKQLRDENEEVLELKEKLKELENEKSEILLREEKVKKENEEVLELKEKVKELENEKSEILLREKQLKDENEEVLELKDKLRELENEKSEILFREKRSKEESEEVLELREKVKELENEKSEILLREKQAKEEIEEVMGLKEKVKELENEKSEMLLREKRSKEESEEVLELREKVKELENEKSEILLREKQAKEESEEVVGLRQRIKELENEKSEMLLREKQAKEESKEVMTLKEKVKELENEKSEILLREKHLKDENDCVVQRNEMLEVSVRDLSERIDVLSELADNRGAEEGVFSISLKEVRVLYEEERETEVVESTSTSTVACQAAMPGDDPQMILWQTNEELRKENETLRSELRGREGKSKVALFAEMAAKLQNAQRELSEAVEERGRLAAVSENLEKERESLRDEVESLRVENYAMKVLAERGGGSEGLGVAETNRKVEKLSDYVRMLTAKLNVMRASNEILMSESHERLRHNQNLVSELEEAWSQRYEIEDQLARVRRENALLNLHRKQLEETNRKISSLVADGKPSVVSWIKIHETVESIVDEVLSLKTSLSDSGSGSSTALDVARTSSELKIMTDTLHAQLRNKTLLCDELIVQKEALERELKGLEAMIREGQEEFGEEVGGLRKRSEVQSRQHTGSGGAGGPVASAGSSHLLTLNRLKRNLADQAELEKVQFHESLKFDIRELKKEMAGTEESRCDRRGSGDGDECLKAIDAQFEREAAELSKELHCEVERLKEVFAEGKEGGESFRKAHGPEIDKLRDYFEKKWTDLLKRCTAAWIAQMGRRLNDCPIPETNPFLQQLERILREETGEEDRRTKLEGLLKDILNRHEAEVRSLREKCEEAVALLEGTHASEVRKLQSVVLELKENISRALKREGSPEGEQRDDLLAKVRAEYEAKLEEEKKRLCESLEEARREHEREMSELEEFWTEKLSECETRCAIMKATRKAKPGIRGEKEERLEEEGTETQSTAPETQQCSEGSEAGERQLVRYSGGSVVGLRRTPGESLCVSNRPMFGEMEVKTDDDKLEVMLQRDALQEMVTAMRSVIAKLLTFVGQQGSGSLEVDDTMYKSIHLDLDRTLSDMSVASNGALVTMELSSMLQEIKENSLLNSSDQVRYELDRCLQQLKKDATCLLALSCPEGSGQGLSELMRRVEKEKEELEGKVEKVEEMQREMRKEINMTRERLSQWERNLEVVSEGYGEGIVEPRQIISLSDLKDRLKQYLSEHCAQSLDFNLLDEICKEGDRLQEEWKREKCDLQQQIEVADKQVHSLKKFLEEQAVEREQEREAFDREISDLQESLKAKERDNSLQNRTNREVEALEAQLKELAGRLSETEKNKTAIEGEFQNAVKKIWSLREVIQDLEVQLAEVSERECSLRKKLERADGVIEEQSKANRSFKEELEAFKNQNELKHAEHIRALEEEVVKLRHVADLVHPESLTQLKASLREVEAALIKKTKDLEQLHVSSANVSCSSPSEDVSIRDHLDATRCSTPEEMCASGQPLAASLPTEEVDRIHEKLARHTRAEEVALKYIRDLKMQLRSHRKAFEDVQTERDVLLERVDVYLKENSGLKVRLEEQRCNAGLLQKQLNANLESQISRLEVDVEKLNDLCNEKDKQLRDLKEILENTTKSLRVRETEALNKSKEENALITTLRTDLANALNENSKLEEKLEKTVGKLRDTLKMPALIDSMLEEKNAEIDRLEKEVARLSSEKTPSTPRSCRSEEKHKRRIRFSEPDSFSENISSISVQCPSDLRNCSENSADLRNSSFKIRRPVGYSTKLESVSSIAPLQLSPRGADFSFTWKTSSPLVRSDSPVKSPPKTSPRQPDLRQMEEMSKLQGEIESKQREISELNLEIDILKRRLVEAMQEVDTAKAQRKEAENEIEAKEEEIRGMRNNEKGLEMAMESLRKKHAEEVEELQNKLRFEHGKVEKVYEEIKVLEVKKVEIEESFLSLREDYNEKMSAERRAGEALVERIRALEAKNEGSERKMAALEKEMGAKARETGKTIQRLTREVVRLRGENEKMRGGSSGRVEAGTQVEGEGCVCQGGLSLETGEGGGGLKGNLEELKEEFEKMAAAIGEREFNKKEAFSYAMAVRRLFSVVLGKVEELSKELESHVKKVMECSVDDLAVRVRKELVLSAKLDNQLLSSIEANGFGSKEGTPQGEGGERVFGDVGGGDGVRVVPRGLGSEAVGKVVGLCDEMREKISELERERRRLEGKVREQEKMIRVLEESLEQEKERILEEKERCCEDAKIMELLRVNLEKGLQDIRGKEKELKREKQQRMALEKEVESYKKQGLKGWEGKKVLELNAQLESQKEKLVSIGKLLEEEKKKNQELKLSLEEVKIERTSEKSALRLVEGDLALVKEQKQNLKTELVKARNLLHTREKEIGLLKRKINLQEIDIKALSFNSLHQQNPSDGSSTVSNGETLVDLCTSSDSPAAMLLKMRKLNSCVQRHAKESSGMDEALLYLGQGREQMRDNLTRLEESSDLRLGEETLVPDVEVERKLWALEKGRLVMDLETLKRENEVLKHDLIDTCKSNEFLKQENCKMKRESREAKSPKESATSQMDALFQQKHASHLTRKYLRAESHRKALSWQKNYLTLMLKEYERSEEALKRMGRKKKEVRRRGHAAGRFRVVALAVVAIFRMRYIVKRWKKNAAPEARSLVDPQALKVKIPVCGSAFDVYNEPVDPLSYQTQNICRQSSSQVLRTPPSRDPGPQGFFFGPKNVRDHMETYDYLQDNIDILKTLPCIFECLND